MAYYNPDRKVLVKEIFPHGTYSIPEDVGNLYIGDIAYDPRSFKRFSGQKQGIKIYFAPYPFVNRGGKEVEANELIPEAIACGAKIIVYKPNPEIDSSLKKSVVFIPVSDPRKYLARVAQRWYGLDRFEIPMYAVTGTKGKTSTTHILHHLLNSLFGKAGLIGSANYFIGNEHIENLSPIINDTCLTTLEPLETTGFIYHFCQQGGKVMILEATSHAFELHRISENVMLSGGIITNLGSDHLNFHKTQSQYKKAKAKIIPLIAKSKLNFPKVLILNSNDINAPYFYRMARDFSVPVYGVGCSNKKTYIPIKYQIEFDKLSKTYTLVSGKESGLLPASLSSEFNVYNASIAIALAKESHGFPIPLLCDQLSNFKGIPGRFEVIQHRPFQVIVDYAHEEMSLTALLKHARAFTKKVIVVMSCTGDRDKAKRSKMGRIAAKMADFTFITNDSTYYEDPVQILDEVERGYRQVRPNGYKVIDDRRKAINEAIKSAKTGDGVYILGMGSEQILNRGGKIIPWSDSKIARKYLRDIHQASKK